MTPIMNDAGLLVARTLNLFLSKIEMLYSYYGLSGILITCLFIFSSYRFLLKPILGGRIVAGGSDKAQRDIHKDKKETSDG